MRHIPRGASARANALNSRKAGRPPGARNKQTAAAREQEQCTLYKLLGGGDRRRAAERVVRGVYEIALDAPIREMLQARIWLAERLFGRLPRRAEPDSTDPVRVVTVHVHPGAPPV